MKKKILWGTIAILIAGVAAGAFWWSRRPQVITFSDDSTVTLLAVDYGKHHAAPALQITVAAQTNRPGAARAARGGPFTTTDDALVLWVRQQYDTTAGFHAFQYFVYDKGGTACARSSGLHPGSGAAGDEVMGVEFSAFPRRHGKLSVAVMENGNGGGEMSDRRFSISNPAHPPSTTWTATPLPATVNDGDLSVTLNELTAGVDMPYTMDSDNPDDPANKGVKAAFHVERNGQPVNNWQPVSVETSDATGNHVAGYGPNFGPAGNNQPNDWANGDGSVTYQYGLWPDEPAWKVRFEFAEQSDFAPDEVWNVPHVPLLPGRQQEMTNTRRQTMTNAPFAEMDINGYHLKLFPAKQFNNVGMNSYMQGGLFIQTAPTLADGYRLTVKAMDDQSNEVQCSEYSGPGRYNLSYRYRLADISGLTNLNVSIALHKSHFVEFTVKPGKAAPEAAQ